jgi:hypothetical protein
MQMQTRHYSRISKAKFIWLAITLSSVAALAETGNCQHPYCDRSAGYDAAVGYRGIIPDPQLSPSTGPVADSLTPRERLEQELRDVGIDRFTASDYKPGIIRHVVLFRYANGVSLSEKEEARKRFLELQRRSLKKGRRYVVSIESGSQTSGEGADQRLEEGFIVTFRSEGDRNYYVGKPIVADPSYFDPAHQAFKDFVGPLLAPNGALVFDFTVGQ